MTPFALTVGFYLYYIQNPIALTKSNNGILFVVQEVKGCRFVVVEPLKVSVNNEQTSSLVGFNVPNLANAVTTEIHHSDRRCRKHVVLMQSEM